MIYTTKIQKAIKFAVKTHQVYQSQVRKGKITPYITHPLTLGLILARAGADEETIIAGILHDTIEDSVKEKKVTREMIAERFGKNVATLVASVTEFNKELSWDERKQAALEHIKTFSHESLLIKSADIMSNGFEVLDDHGRIGDEVFTNFKGGKEKTLRHYLHIIAAILENWPENPLASDLVYLAGQMQMIGVEFFMVKSPATIIEYSDYDENAPLECSVCGWKGTAKSSGCVNTDSHYCLDVSCPVCDKMLLVANYASA